MELTVRVRTARTPLPAAMAIALAAAALSSLSTASQAQAQNQGNAQAEQSQSLRNRNAVEARAVPPTGRYVAESGEAFILDRSGQRPLLRFDRRDETWVLRPTAAPRGDVIYRNDAGDQLLRVTPGGGMMFVSFDHLRKLFELIKAGREHLISKGGGREASVTSITE